MFLIFLFPWNVPSAMLFLSLYAVLSQAVSSPGMYVIVVEGASEEEEEAPTPLVTEPAGVTEPEPFRRLGLSQPLITVFSVGAVVFAGTDDEDDAPADLLEEEVTTGCWMELWVLTWEGWM